MNEANKNLKGSPLYESLHGDGESRGTSLFYLVLTLVLLAVFAFRVYLVDNYGGVEVSGSSMYQTLYDGEQLLMKNSDGTDAKRGDVIVVYVGNYDEFGGSNTKFLIKRLIAVEGDKIRCTKGEMEICYAGTNAWVDLDEPYAYYTDKDKYTSAEYTVGEGEVFFLGDNRNNSHDSRYQEGGSRLDRLYKRSDIVGIVPQWSIDYQWVIEKIFFNPIGGFVASKKTEK